MAIIKKSTTRSNLDILRDHYGVNVVKTTKDFKNRYDKDATELEKIVYGLEESDRSTNMFDSLIYGQNPFLRMIPQDNFQGATMPVPIKIK